MVNESFAPGGLGWICFKCIAAGVTSWEALSTRTVTSTRTPCLSIVVLCTSEHTNAMVLLDRG